MTDSRWPLVAICAAALAGTCALPARAMTEKELCQLYLDVAELTVDVFEPIWVDDSKNVPNAGYYDFRKYDTWGPKWYANVVTVPGCGQIVYCYSLLLSETDKQTFGKTKLSRADMLDRCIKAIRWCCLTSAYAKNPYPFHPVVDAHDFYEDKQWRRKLGYRADELGWFTVAAARLWDKLDDETRGLVEQVMIGGAQPERLVRTWDGHQGGNHDVVKQDLASTIGAAFLFPKRADHAKYQEIIRGNGIDLVATVHDQACNVKADGKTVSEWSMGAWNLYQDYSSDHHGWCQVWYGCDLIFEGRLYIELLSHIYKTPVPEVYRYPGNGFDGVLEWVKTTCLPEGEPASVHGMEYDAYYGSALLAYCYSATIKKDRVAAALEEQAAQLLRRHTDAVRLYDYHRNCYAKAATCYLLHKIHGPRAEPLSLPEAWSARNGAYHYRWQQCLVHRSDNKWASFSWGTVSGHGLTGMCGFIVPAKDGKGADEPFVYLMETSLIGGHRVTVDGKPVKGPSPDVVYRSTCSDDGYATSGVVTEPGLDRYYAFFSFDNGPCVMLRQYRARQDCTMYFAGMPVYFYNRLKLTSSRTYYDAQGTQPLENAAQRKSSWWCVDDRLGVITDGGTDRIRIKRVVGRNWARTDAYKDKADEIHIGTTGDMKVKAGALGVDVAAVFYTETPHDKIAGACAELGKGTLKLPMGWKGVVVPDAARPHMRYLAVANFDAKTDTTALAMTFEEGAPLLSSGSIISGNTGRSCLRIERLGSFGQALELYAGTPQGQSIQGRRVSRGIYQLRNAGAVAVTATLYRPGGAGQECVITTDSGTKTERFGDDGRLRVQVAGPTTISLPAVLSADRTGPAVEITDLVHREDGQVRIEVAAVDASGIEGVELFCDGRPIGHRPGGSYVFVHRPGNGAHTYHAVATDASPQKNKRTSFKRTIVVERGKTRP